VTSAEPAVDALVGLPKNQRFKNKNTVSILVVTVTELADGSIGVGLPENQMFL
jgi:hypothetical protein